MGDLEDEAGLIGRVEQSLDQGGTPVLRISGEIDMSNISSIASRIDAVLATGPDRLVFDLAALDFIDSSGIALLLSAAQQVDRVEVRNPSAIMKRVIQATGLTDILHVQP